MFQALIVDDSKTVRIALKKMLSRYDIRAEGVESGEQALEYLRSHTPQLIFMDHMMPGMDGFETVKAIKADPHKSSIPIVMHTSKSGEMYVGQARALGAADILTKPATDDALQNVLARIRQPRKASSASVPKVSVPAVETRAMTAEMPAVTDADIARSQRAASLEIERAVTEPVPVVRSPEPSYAEPPATGLAGYSPLRQVIAAALLVAPVIWVLGLYISADQERSDLLKGQYALYQTVGWGVSQAAGYDFGELPMSGKRLELLRDLVEQLVNVNFKGVIRVEGHVGEFCLVREQLSDGTEVNMLPAVETPLSDCAVIGSSSTSALAESGKQSIAFRDFLDNSPLLKGSGIRVDVVQLGSSRPLYEYPLDIENASAGDWNTVALMNNRVEFHLQPSSNRGNGLRF